MNTPPNKHSIEPKDVGTSNSNSSGINIAQRKILPDSKFHRGLHTPHMAEPPGALINQVGFKFPELFQQKYGSYANLPASKITELMKSSSLDNAPTQSLLSVVNGILEESVERRNGEIPPRVACLLRKVVQEIERRISTQQQHLRTQNNLFKTREEKYQSRIRVLEALASRTGEENKNENVIKEEKVSRDSKSIENSIKTNISNEEKKTNDEIHTKNVDKEEKKTIDSVDIEKTTMEEKKEIDKEVIRLVKEVEDKNVEISTLKQKLEKTKEGEKKEFDKEIMRLNKEVEDKNVEISKLKKDLEKTKGEENKEIDKEIMRLNKEVGEKNVEISKLKNDLDKNKEEENKGIDKEIMRLNKEVEEKNMEISKLKKDLEKTKEEKNKEIDKEIVRLNKEVEEKNLEISKLKQDVEKTRGEEKNEIDKKVNKLIKEVEEKNVEISRMKQELETTKKGYEVQCSKLELEVKDAKGELKEKSQEYEDLLEKLRNRIKENEALNESKYQKWNMKEKIMKKAMNFQFSSIQNLKLSWESIKQDVMKEQKIYSEECNRLGVNLKPLIHAAENYQTILAENRKLFNEVQELKGNIRVYCRIRPFLPGQKEKQSIVEHIGESDLVVANPSKQGKEALKTFKFNKIFGPLSTQAEVYDDIQGFIRSVLDGYNVCIFAYGQTGSGKTYTMSGPNGATSESLGVNYRALNDLFNISSSRQTSIVYEIGVQMIEIYNEQVRDLLSTDTSTKKLGILNHSQPNGLAVPDASMHPVKSTNDVIKLMDIGFKNRAKGSTAMNERSSRSHSVVSIHVRGADKKSGSNLQGNLHLVDLAGSERIDRSEVVGDRLKEAQHINKSLSALGDVIFALSQKNAHIPYRNSKLTQILQSSLGGQAKTLMLVQINSDIKSYSESLSTLKFAERVSGVELGVAKSTKEGRDVRELMEQVASLKDTISTKDEEIERLHVLKDLKKESS